MEQVSNPPPKRDFWLYTGLVAVSLVTNLKFQDNRALWLDKTFVNRLVPYALSEIMQRFCNLAFCDNGQWRFNVMKNTIFHQNGQ